MRKLNSNLVMDFISEKGNDQIEKTYIACTPLENYMCIAIAESYDNETEENSAQIAVQAALSAFVRKPSLKRIPEYIRYANKQIFLHSTGCQLKVSLTVFVTDYTWMRYAICGNTKLYCIYENIFTLTGRTQTIYQQLLDKDAGTEPDQSEIHNLTGYLGKNHHIKPLISRKTRLTEGSVLLFATSNMWGRLSDVEILDAYENTKTNKEFLDTLQEMLLSLQGQGQQKIGSYTAAFLSVKRKLRHADRQALTSPRFICTKGEIERIISSYEVSDEFDLIDICMDFKETVPVLDMNSFIKSHSLLKPKRKISLILHPKNSTDIFRYEKMFFLLAELQLYTDEFE